MQRHLSLFKEYIVTDTYLQFVSKKISTSHFKAGGATPVTQAMA